MPQDFEKLRRHLGVDTWVLFGGSWGTALSLAYAQCHTDRCPPPPSPSRSVHLPPSASHCKSSVQ